MMVQTSVQGKEKEQEKENEPEGKVRSGANRTVVLWDRQV